MSTRRERLLAPVDASSLAFFRIGFGALSAWEVWRVYDGNQIHVDYELPTYHFRWWLFDWVHPAPGIWLYVTFAVIGISAFLIAIGLFYRTAAVVHWAGLSYWILFDKVTYLNHRYLTAVLGFLLIFVPAHAAFSLDALRKPWVRSDTLPAWALWLLRFQVAVPYFFSGVAKLNYDWLVRAEPLRTWLADRTDFPLVGRLFGEEIVVRFMSVGSAAVDLFVPFLLLHRKTRAPAFALAVVFHFMNARLFEIGIFPWMMIVATTIFFEPSWPRRLVDQLRTGPIGVRALLLGAFAVGCVVGAALPHSLTFVQTVVGGLGVAVAVFHFLPARVWDRRIPSAPATPWRRFVASRVLVGLLATWAILQVMLPLRHFVIPGDVSWTEEGQRFSWQLLVHSKSAAVAFVLTDPASGDKWVENLDRHLTPHQISKLNDPDMLVQFAHHLDGLYRDAGADVEVRVESVASLNGRTRQPLVDSIVDLSEVSRPYVPPADWIVPLKPLRG